ncbi:MAG TPA: C4-dicarboxylate transporter DctA [Opitutaceae bacterium]|nr:C4-dicarboxylate transporter DctA [Opitutaceae bacterium]
MTTSAPVRSSILGRLYTQVLIAIVVGVIVGGFLPNVGVALRPLGDGFIRLIRMLLAPIIGGTIVVGIAKVDNLKAVGRIGLKALVYFEVVSTLALLIGLVVVNVLRPGAGMNVNPAELDASSIASYTATAATQEKEGAADFFLRIIPTSVVDAFARGDMLQIILFSLLLGIALARFRAQTEPLLRVIDSLLHALFAVVGMIMRLAPLAALGAMAFTVGKYGFGVLASLGQLMIAVYLTCLLFIGGVLGLIARASGVNLWKLIRYLREEIVIVFATVSTEAVLPRMMTKLENAGCSRPVVGLVLPAGYTFNPDGTAIYLTMAAIFVAQATNTPLTLGDQIFVLGVLMLTSKGSAGVAGAGFVTLAATLTSLHKIPVAGLVLLLGVDRFINEARAVTNLIGNSVATLAIARWDKALDVRRLDAVLSCGRPPGDDA